MREVMKVQPKVGRFFSTQDLEERNLTVVVVTDFFAKQHFASASDALGKSIYINNQSYMIVGGNARGCLFPRESTDRIALATCFLKTGKNQNFGLGFSVSVREFEPFRSDRDSSSLCPIAATIRFREPFAAYRAV